jgi:hypothetical protein
VGGICSGPSSGEGHGSGVDRGAPNVRRQGPVDTGSRRWANSGARRKGETVASLIDLVTSSLGSGGIGAIAGQLGIDEDKVPGAVQTALSVLTGAVAKNAAKPKGAASLDAALAKDHDGSVLDKVGDLISTPAAGPGAGILGHVLGKKQSTVAAAIGQETGLSKEQSGNLLATLAPLLMGALGKAKQENGLDASGLSSMLAGESRQIQQSASGGLGKLLGMVGGASGLMGLLGKAAPFLKGLMGEPQPALMRAALMASAVCRRWTSSS